MLKEKLKILEYELRKEIVEFKDKLKETIANEGKTKGKINYFRKTI